jgi:hypothetical protein
VAYPHVLPRHLLDGNIESLHQVDSYLLHVHQHRDGLSDDEWSLTILRAGAYVGEVMRHAAPQGAFRWVDYDEYIPEHPEMQSLLPERTTATCAFLVSPGGEMCMPLNKIARFIDEGAENSVHFFAAAFLKDKCG